ncbi:hypothetical protein [Microbacterium sp. PMB16]|uniref:hypothetical protein n=1 Tax=Microbacterium sp. PMB16 TaxID=3120157 RepID=UPI003F4B9198
MSSPPHFALTSADVVSAAGRAYPVNLIFVAESDDPIWTDLTGVELPDDASVGPGQFDVIRGEGADGYRLGNIAFDVDVPPHGLSFDSVGLVYADSTEPTPVDVGSWTFAQAPPEEFATADTQSEVAAMRGCTSAELPVPASTASIETFHTGSSDVQVERAVLDPESNALSITLSCTDEADFHIISPTLDYSDSTGAAKSLRFAPIAIGFQDIDDEDLRRIRARENST